MKVKIISEGNSLNTKIIDARTGQPIEGVEKIIWRCTVGGLCRAELHLVDVPAVLKGVAKIKRKLFSSKQLKRKISIEKLIEWERNKNGGRLI